MTITWQQAMIGMACLIVLIVAIEAARVWFQER